MMFPFFRRKKTKVEIVRDAIVERVHDALEHIPVDRLEHLKDSLGSAAHEGGDRVSRGASSALHVAGDALHAAAATASGVKEHITDAAQGALAGVGIKAAKRTPSALLALHGVQERAHDLGESARSTASQTVSGALEATRAKAEAAKVAAEAAQSAAREKLEAAREAASHKAEAARETFAAHAHHASDNVNDRVTFAQQTAQDASGDASRTWAGAISGLSHLFGSGKEHVEESAADLSKAAGAAKAALAAKVAREGKDKADQVKKLRREVEAEVQIEEGHSRFLWFALGLLVGGVIVLLLAPSTGRRNRAAIKDKLNKTKSDAAKLGESAAQRAADLSRRAGGAVHEVKASRDGAEDDADDNTIADRVRTELGQNPATRDLPNLNIDCVEGVVTVRGPMSDVAQSALIEGVIAAVKGVKEVRPELLVEDAPEDEATFVG